MVVQGIAMSGVRAAVKAAVGANGVSGASGVFLYAKASYNAVIVRGQSNAIASSGTNPVLTTSPVTNAWMLDATRAPNISASAFTAMQESAVANVETINSGFAGQVARMISDLAISEEHNIVGGSSGASGIALSTLIEGTGYFNTSVSFIAKAFELSAAIPKNCVNSAWVWMQGEADAATAIADYKTMFLEMKSDWEAAVAIETGQALPPLCLSYQVRSGNVCQAQYEMQRDSAGIIIPAPSYMLDFIDTVHYTNHSMRRLGAYFAKAYVRTVLQGAPFIPCRPTTITVNGNQVIVIKFEFPGDYLVWDFTKTGSGVTSNAMSNPASGIVNGFSVVHSDLVARPIASVEITDTDEVTITMQTASISSGDILRYSSSVSYRTVTSGTLFTGTYGNLRDTGDSIATAYDDSDASDYKLNNWCLAFEEALDV